MVNNKVIGEYAHTKMGDFYLPIMWSFPIPLSNGGEGTLHELAASGLFMRGIWSDTGGHGDNLVRQNTPVTGAPSFSGIFADSGNAPLPTGDNFNYKKFKFIGPF